MRLLAFVCVLLLAHAHAQATLTTSRISAKSSIHAMARVASDNIEPASSSCGGDFAPVVVWPAQLPDHQTGSALNGTAWVVTVQDPENEYMTYGPYTTACTSVPTRVDFVLSIDNNVNDDLRILTLDVNDATTQTVLVTRDVLRTDFAYANTALVFSMFFTNMNCAHELEFRVFYYCCAEVIHYETIARPLDEGPLGALWAQQMTPRPVSVSGFPTFTNSSADETANEGTQFIPLNGRWYLFGREMNYVDTPAMCSSVIPIFRIVVRYSTDRGVTWSEKAVVAEPSNEGPNAEWYNCALVDGSGFYDNQTDTWHYLSQCIGTGAAWGMCHYYMSGSDPTTGDWQADLSNPVVKGGQLWSQICSGDGKHCTEGTVDEGTPEIVEKVNGFFYVTFHGYDYSTLKSARGVAKTPDFVVWLVAGYDLPNDAIFSSTDCNPWDVAWASGGCVGGGEGSIVKSGDYYYEIIEAPDVALSCETTYGEQNWVEGFMRSPSLYFPSGTWDEFGANPAVVPWQKYGCALQYARLFVDAGVYYLAFWLNDFPAGTSGLQVFELAAEPFSYPLTAAPNGTLFY